jgi:FAD/FMN-containing dehydrogenase
MIDTKLLERFSNIVGSSHILVSDEDKAPYLQEWRDIYHGKTPFVIKPGTTREVAEILQLAYETSTPVVPQGGNTGLVGGQIPHENNSEIVLSLSRFNRIRSVDAQDNSCVCEAGVILQKAQEAADEANRLFPLSLGSEGSCTIGGVLSTNAGGTAVLAYGNARDLTLGLEVVTAEGRIWNGLKSLRKDNTGYDLKHLFIGSEGSLGIITAASLKLFPRPRAQAVAFAGLESPESALTFLNLAKDMAGQSLTGFELMPRLGIEFILKHQDASRDPLEGPHSWYVLVELSSGDPQEALDARMMALLGNALEKQIIQDAAPAQSLNQAQQFWRMRHGMSEVQKHEGGSIKHDISVPVSKVPAFLKVAIKPLKR